MPAKKSKKYPMSFSSGIVQSRSIARVIAQYDDLVKRGEPDTAILKWDSGKWTVSDLDWTVVRMWVSLKAGVEVFATSPLGHVLAASLRGSAEEDMDTGRTGPTAQGFIRDLRGIGDHLYACGMSRQVYRREGPGRWSHQDQGIVSDVGAIGFNAIDGIDEGDFTAVGYGGEIWRNRRNRWKQSDSPTNLMLNRVRVVDKDVAFACGQKGVLLRRTDESWADIQHEETEDDFWGMEWFSDALYVATDNQVYRLRDPDNLEPVSGKQLQWCGDLHTADGVLWSVGTKQVAWTSDGRKWNDVTP